MYDAQILADSISPKGVRLTTFQVTFPRFILAEFNTHRMFSRSSASTRAVPLIRQIDRVVNDPFIPERFPRNEPGMSNKEWLSGDEEVEARVCWLYAADRAVETAQRLSAFKVHKQIAGRVMEPFMWHTVICTATDWNNFWHLRISANAQPEMLRTATLMAHCYQMSTPVEVGFYEWHLPLTGFPGDEGLDGYDLRRVAAARCARVSYLTHEGVRDVQADFDLFTRLVSNGHLSPLEHVATPNADDFYHANFKGWTQYRASIPFESGQQRPASV